MEIIIGLFIQCSCNYIGKYLINSTFPMIYQLGEPLVSLWHVASTLDHPSKFNVYPGPRGFHLFFTAKFCDANRFYYFCYRHEAVRALKASG